MLKVWGRKNSINVQKVMWCIGELGLAHERVDVGGKFGGNNEDWYRAMNPTGRVPTIEDDGFVLWNSNAIVRYLAGKHAFGTLYPSDLRDRAVAEQWMDWQGSELNSGFRDVFWQLIRTPEAERDADVINQSIDTSAQNFAMLDRRLEGRDYVLGDTFTMADIPVGATVFRWFELDIPRPDMPNLRAWYDRLAERETYRQHVMMPLS